VKNRVTNILLTEHINSLKEVKAVQTKKSSINSIQAEIDQSNNLDDSLKEVYKAKLFSLAQSSTVSKQVVVQTTNPFSRMLIATTIPSLLKRNLDTVISCATEA
jgi:hypothetical protein